MIDCDDGRRRLMSKVGGVALGTNVQAQQRGLGFHAHEGAAASAVDQTAYRVRCDWPITDSPL